jgi:hypothetical protein
VICVVADAVWMLLGRTPPPVPDRLIVLDADTMIVTGPPNEDPRRIEAGRLPGCPSLDDSMDMTTDSINGD